MLNTVLSDILGIKSEYGIAKEGERLMKTDNVSVASVRYIKKRKGFMLHRDSYRSECREIWIQVK